MGAPGYRVPGAVGSMVLTCGRPITITTAAAPAGNGGAFSFGRVSIGCLSRASVGRALPGGVPEWLKGTDCKSVGFAYAGSNPAPSTRFPDCGCSSMVEQQPSKLMTRVRFPSPALIFSTVCEDSSPEWSSRRYDRHRGRTEVPKALMLLRLSLVSTSQVAGSDQARSVTDSSR